MNVSEILNKVVNGCDLSFAEAESAMRNIMDGKLTSAQIAALAVSLRIKGETEDEIAGFVTAMKDGAIHLPQFFPDSVDTCGTGGDKLNTFNISTVAAIVASGAGVIIAKHGNRSASSKSGSADVLESLGINLNVNIGTELRALNEIGIAFLFARAHHPALKHAGAARKEIGIRTIFNLIGPMTNPAGARIQLMGVFREADIIKVANVLKKLGAKRAMVVSGHDGMDEISLSSTTDIAELKDNNIISYQISPEDFGIKTASLETIKGGLPDDNAKITLEILSGSCGPRADIVLLNAGAVIYLSGKTDCIKSGIELARQSISSGAAAKKLHQLIAITNSS
ncbi:MAG: anthranilate phosphoribosyltransferase [Chlamydiae bacterium]|nr:MAG: anthranilate phosphoribosyltransferase [Chlamydiota bacterium]